jgi:hypothetical protein
MLCIEWARRSGQVCEARRMFAISSYFAFSLFGSFCLVTLVFLGLYVYMGGAVRTGSCKAVLADD